ncbi:hypothetical protein MBAV_004170 [Candidatus Magnetobacterium bavaricum]|uniref:Toprim domain-containing protein n=1 Tax=Candidatus Magnetobacterium bavaricum TaxID=29290 RepID=A0A0F3GP91_9BACT|nr:hypothetical protein MBAV_004170 [Candidatus Magnetobacterium bavaricum]
MRLKGLSLKDAMETLKVNGNGNGNGKNKKNKENGGKTIPLSDNEDVQRLHMALLNNVNVFNVFKNKYGISIDTATDYRIGYDDVAKAYAIPILQKDGLFNVKRHKKFQASGAETVLYPTSAIEEAKVITEGEFKALLLNQLGIPAVSGTGGAGTWKNEWSECFRGKDVIVAYDMDKAGKEGTLKVAKALSGIAASIKTIVWDMHLPNKDVTDYFVSLNKTRKDFLEMMTNAVDIVIESKPEFNQTSLPFCFWEEEAGNTPKLKINTSNLILQLEKDGFKKLRLSARDLQKIVVKIKENLIKEVDLSTIRNYVFTTYLDTLPGRISHSFSKDDLRKKLIDGINTYVELGKLDALPVVTIIFSERQKRYIIFLFQ